MENSSWPVFLSREVDGMQGFWSAACSPVNNAQRRGTPLREEGLHLLLAAEDGPHPEYCMLFWGPHVCRACWLTQSDNPKVSQHRERRTHQKVRLFQSYRAYFTGQLKDFSVLRNMRLTYKTVFLMRRLKFKFSPTEHILLFVWCV